MHIILELLDDVSLAEIFSIIKGSLDVLPFDARDHVREYVFERIGFHEDIGAGQILRQLGVSVSGGGGFALKKRVNPLPYCIIRNERDDPKIIEYFRDIGADIFDTDGGGRTLLFLAAMYERIECAKYCCKLGMDINHKESFSGQTCFWEYLFRLNVKENYEMYSI